MDILLEGWRREIVEELLASLPKPAEDIIRGKGEKLVLGPVDRHMGMGVTTEGGVVTINQNVIHPVCFAEVAGHELGHLVEVYLRQDKGIIIMQEGSVHACYVAHGIPVSAFRPDKFKGDKLWDTVRTVYNGVVYDGQKFRKNPLEAIAGACRTALTEHEAAIGALNQLPEEKAGETLTAAGLGRSVARFKERRFEQQATGYLFTVLGEAYKAKPLTK